MSSSAPARRPVVASLVYRAPGVPLVVERWVTLTGPDGRTVELKRVHKFFLLPGENTTRSLVIAPKYLKEPGRYTLSVHWRDPSRVTKTRSTAFLFGDVRLP